MFLNFFFSLKAYGIPVSLHEWIALHEALSQSLNRCSLSRFYYVARAILVKNEIFFDKYDLAFLDCFEGIETTDDVLDKIMEGLKKVKELHLSEEEKSHYRKEKDNPFINREQSAERNMFK